MVMLNLSPIEEAKQPRNKEDDIFAVRYVVLLTLSSAAPDILCSSSEEEGPEEGELKARTCGSSCFVGLFLCCCTWCAC